MMRHLFVAGITSLMFMFAVSSGALADFGHSPSFTSDLSETPEGNYDRNVALVIGNSSYNEQPLMTAVHDARAIASLVGGMGFDVIALENATLDEMQQGLADFRKRLGEDGVGLFYYAGHGVQVGNTGVLLPVDANTGSAETVLESGLQIQAIIKRMSAQRPDHPNLVIIDACLNNPFLESSPASADAAPLPALPDQTYLAMSTSPGSVAYDGSGKHSVYTTELLRLLSQQNVAVDNIFRQVKLAVSQQTGYVQKPWTQSTLKYPLHLPTPAVSASMSANQSGVPGHMIAEMRTRGILPQDGEARYELEFWESIKDSTDASDYEAYLEAYPDGRFAPLARARAARYKKKAAPSAPRPVALKIDEMDVWYEVVSNANLRKNPSSRAPRLGELKSGSTVHVTGKVSGQNWFRVAIPGGVSGFVYGDLVRKPAPKPKPKPKPKPIAKPKPVPVPVPVKVEQPKIEKYKLEVIKDCSACPEMVVLPSGTFTMGDNRGDPSEKPARQVSINKPFAIGKYEVTVGQWGECVRAGACSHKSETTGTSENAPARDISWADAREYVQWLGTMTGKNYRLPTEAEWEYAARAGTQTRYSWGDRLGSGNADCKDCGGKWDRKVPAEVGAFPANPFGLHGMNGGVWEWVSDCWHKSYRGAPKNATSWESPDCRQHVIRGGSWRNDSSYIHSASRFKYDTNVRYLLNGFRVAKDLD